MATNPYITKAYRPEQNLLEDLTIESLKMYGQDLYYLPRTIVNEDKILGDDVPSLFSSSYKVEMYIENTEGFDGEGDLFAKFGVEIRDQATFVLARRRWQNTVASRNNEINGSRPREGDLIYLPLSNSLFQIMQVEHESPFYQLIIYIPISCVVNCLNTMMKILTLALMLLTILKQTMPTNISCLWIALQLTTLLVRM